MRTGHWIAIGGISGFIGVSAGAFGAHGLKEKLSAEMLAVFETAARYQMYHAMALLVVGLACRQRLTGSLQVAGWGFLIGTGLFSGSLYVLAMTGVKWLGAITPLGGLAFLVGWAALAVYGIGQSSTVNESIPPAYSANSPQILGD